jgi:hypothetical protein
MIASGFLLAACAGREAHPVDVVQPMDASMDCPAIGMTISANEQQIRTLDGERGSHNTDNAIVGTVGVLLFWPALFALDTTDYEKQEMTALHERDQYLQQVAMKKGCYGAPSAPPAPTSAAVTPTPVPVPSTQTAVSQTQASAQAPGGVPYCSVWASGPSTGNCVPRPSQMPSD